MLDTREYTRLKDASNKIHNPPELTPVRNFLVTCSDSRSRKASDPKQSRQLST